jgi:transcriptional regulator with XRE-family HTH domain
MSESKTLKEWRELRGYTVQELADRTGFPPARIRRWEEVGFDFYADTREGDPLFQEAMTKLNRVLGPIPEGMSVVEAPSQPVPGDWVLRPVDTEILDELASRREEYGARLVVPTRWGPAIKEYKDTTLADHKAKGEYAKAEVEWLQAEGQSFLDAADFIEAQQENPDEENLTLGEAIERHERSVAEVRRIVGEEAPETEEELREEEPRKVMLVPAFYPNFDNPDRWHRRDENAPQHLSHLKALLSREHPPPPGAL